MIADLVWSLAVFISDLSYGGLIHPFSVWTGSGTTLLTCRLSTVIRLRWMCSVRADYVVLPFSSGQFSLFPVSVSIHKTMLKFFRRFHGIIVDTLAIPAHHVVRDLLIRAWWNICYTAPSCPLLLFGGLFARFDLLFCGRKFLLLVWC